MKARVATVLVAFVILAHAGCEDPSNQNRHLEGDWSLAGYSDHGVAGETTGFAHFRHDDTFEIRGTVTYPGEPTDSVIVSGTYAAVADIVTLTTADGSGSWRMTFAENTVLLSLIGSTPPTTITLRKDDALESQGGRHVLWRGTPGS